MCTGWTLELVSLPLCVKGRKPRGKSWRIGKVIIGKENEAQSLPSEPGTLPYFPHSSPHLVYPQISPCCRMIKDSPAWSLPDNFCCVAKQLGLLFQKKEPRVWPSSLPQLLPPSPTSQNLKEGASPTHGRRSGMQCWGIRLGEVV